MCFDPPITALEKVALQPYENRLPYPVYSRHSFVSAALGRIVLELLLARAASIAIIERCSFRCNRALITA